MADGAVDTWKTPTYACLACGWVVDAASNSPLEPEPRRPEEGDVTICLKCSHVAIFTKDLTIREPTREEFDEIASDDGVLMLLQAMAVLRKTKEWRERKNGR